MESSGTSGAAGSRLVALHLCRHAIDGTDGRLGSADLRVGPHSIGNPTPVASCSSERASSGSTRWIARMPSPAAAVRRCRGWSSMNTARSGKRRARSRRAGRCGDRACAAGPRSSRRSRRTARAAPPPSSPRGRRRRCWCRWRAGSRPPSGASPGAPSARTRPSRHRSRRRRPPPASAACRRSRPIEQRPTRRTPRT